MSIFVEENESSDVVGFIKKIQEEEFKGFQFGLLPKLNDAMSGFNTGFYYLIAGMSKSGKTTLLVQMVFASLLNLFKENRTKDVEFVYFELEINRTILKAKIISLAIFVLTKGETCININAILKFGNEKLTEEEISVIAEHQPTLDVLLSTIRFVSKQEVKIPSLFASKCENILSYNEGKTTTFIIDHISILGSNDKKKMDEISEAIVDLKNRYRKESIFIVLQQANRRMYDISRRQMDGDNLQFTAEDLKDTGNTLQDCDVCITIYNPYELSSITKMSGYELDRCFGSLRRIDFIKQRYGALFMIRFFMSNGTFITELENASEEEYTKIETIQNLWLR